jgi:hypothetical protein
MKDKKTKDKWLHIRLSEDEHKKIHDDFKRSTCRKLSEFARTKLLEKPVTILYRNQSLDAFMSELIRLRKDLNAIGNNFNQSVKKLHTMNHVQDVRAWITAYETERDAIQLVAEKINAGIKKISETWLQSSKPDRP